MKIRGLTVSHGGAIIRVKFSQCMVVASLVNHVVLWGNRHGKNGNVELAKVPNGYTFTIDGAKLGPMSKDECFTLGSHLFRAHNAFRVIKGGAC